MLEICLFYNAFKYRQSALRTKIIGLVNWWIFLTQKIHLTKKAYFYLREDNSTYILHVPYYVPMQKGTDPFSIYLRRWEKKNFLTGFIHLLCGFH